MLSSAPLNSAVPKSAPWRAAGFLAVAALFVYLQTFVLGDVPVLGTADQSIYLLNARRMLEGQVIYRDFFQFTPPGTETLYWTLFKLFGVRAWIPEAALVALGVALVWFGIVISRRLMHGASVYLAGLLFLGFPFQASLDGTHHWYSTLAALASLAVLIDSRRARRLAAAGVFCGISAWFTQARGLAVLTGLAAFLIWECRHTRQTWTWLVRNGASLVGGFLAAVAVLNGYFAWKAGFRQFWYCIAVFGTKYYTSDEINTWRTYGTSVPSIHGWYQSPDLLIWLSVHVLVPLVYILFLVRFWREAARRPEQPWDRLMLVNFVGLFLFLGVAAAPSYLRLCTVALPALILLVWFVNWPGTPERLLRGLCWAVAISLMTIETAHVQRHWRATLELATGRQAFLYPEDYDTCRWFLVHAQPSDYLFGDAYLNFVLGLREPAQIDFVRPTDYTRPEQVERLIEDLERTRTRWVVSLEYLGPPDPAKDHLGLLRSYLLRQYRVAGILADSGQVLERK